MGEATTPTAAERVETLGQVVGWTGEVVSLPPDQLPDHLQAPSDWRYELATDTQCLYDVLDFHPPVSFEAALRRTADWERAQRSTGADSPINEYAAEDAALRQIS